MDTDGPSDTTEGILPHPFWYVVLGSRVAVHESVVPEIQSLLLSRKGMGN